jgi:hypothetical protein
MFSAFSARQPWIRNIKYAVWFSSNDYSYHEGHGRHYVANQYKLVPEQAETLEAFRAGFTGAAPHRIRSIGGTQILWTGQGTVSAGNPRAAEITVANDVNRLENDSFVTAAATSAKQYFSDPGFSVPITLPIRLDVNRPVDIYIRTAAAPHAPLFYKVTVTREARRFVTGDYLRLRTADEWMSIPSNPNANNPNRVDVTEFPGGGVILRNSATSGHPNATAWATNALIIPRAEWGNYVLNYDFTVSHRASIILRTHHSEIRFTNLILNDFRPGHGIDMFAGTYLNSINLAELLALFHYGQPFFHAAGIQVFTVGNRATVTLREFEIVRICDACRENRCLCRCDDGYNVVSMLPATTVSNLNLYDKHGTHTNPLTAPANQAESFINSRIDGGSLVLQYSHHGNQPWTHATAMYRLPEPVIVGLDDKLGWDIDVLRPNGGLRLFFADIPVSGAALAGEPGGDYGYELNLTPAITGNRANVTDIPVGAYRNELTLRDIINRNIGSAVPLYDQQAKAVMEKAQANNDTLTLYFVGYTVALGIFDPAAGERNVDIVRFSDVYAKTAIPPDPRFGYVLERDTVTAADASFAFRGLLGLVTLTEEQVFAAKLGDPELTIGHVLRIFRFALGLSYRL